MDELKDKLINIFIFNIIINKSKLAIKRSISGNNQYYESIDYGLYMVSSQRINEKMNASNEKDGLTKAPEKIDCSDLINIWKTLKDNLKVLQDF